ncbi:hypothetical protein PF005_g29429 [Phytophthora fragariae]|uniref:Uncharacterized protein n=1 Tax=Phytophthora fragariae TaxID=53985 RepID=A0A6A3VFF9_9STRA|nr:hypothetical protein PF011_g28489 [Phytophthora fragariae]KAE9165870.1 hypothetical protein PF005_g29429 [Phytophthora fragariae]KAE9171326.1 hypothetical protein PF002_g29851 [Phytophthora fragariae]
MRTLCPHSSAHDERFIATEGQQRQDQRQERTHPDRRRCPCHRPAQVKPASAKATAAATQAPKAAATIAAAPTREVASAGKKPTTDKNGNGGKNANASNKNAGTNATAKAAKSNADMNAKSTTPFAMSDVTAGSVQRARQIRKTDFERFQKFYNFWNRSKCAGP